LGCIIGTPEKPGLIISQGTISVRRDAFAVGSQSRSKKLERQPLKVWDNP
jgi:hypothetical protein